MKKIVKLLLSVIVIISLFSACNFAASYQVKTLKVETGDTFAATLATKSHVWDISMDKNIFCVCENDDVKFRWAFFTESTFINQVYNISNSLNCEDRTFVSQGETNGLRYVLVSFTNEDGGQTYEVIGWIVGSNTGIIGECTESEEIMNEMLEALTFKIKKTDQNDDSYYCTAIEQLEK